MTARTADVKSEWTALREEWDAIKDKMERVLWIRKHYCALLRNHSDKDCKYIMDQWSHWCNQCWAHIRHGANTGADKNDLKAYNEAKKGLGSKHV